MLSPQIRRFLCPLPLEHPFSTPKGQLSIVGAKLACFVCCVLYLVPGIAAGGAILSFLLLLDRPILRADKSVFHPLTGNGRLVQHFNIFGLFAALNFAHVSSLLENFPSPGLVVIS